MPIVKSYHYKKKLYATDAQQTLTLPLLRSFSVFNSGDYDVLLEFENDIDADSVLLPAGSSYESSLGYLDLRYKCNPAESTTLYVTGVRQEKI